MASGASQEQGRGRPGWSGHTVTNGRTTSPSLRRLGEELTHYRCLAHGRAAREWIAY
ncbi:hypothetical protein [Streptomyces sp. NPDC050704]|uniref:hypothetical protein n=1 Tax=Streptomyces sp. NPDC050704 TaxID=3157219 RepID=UPI0034371E19